ncbi:MAG: ATP-binding protein, partial [Syntrophales bacterium]
MKIGLFYKLLIAFVATGILAVLIAGFIIQGQIRDGLTHWIEEDLVTRARIISVMPDDEIRRDASILSKQAQARITLVDAAGQVTFDSETKIDDMDNHLNRPEIQEARLKGSGKAIRYSHTLKVDMLYVALPLYEKGEIKGYIRLAHPLSEIAASVGRIKDTVCLVILLVVRLSMLIAMGFSIKLISPIWDMEEFTERIKKGNVSGTLMVQSGDEIGRLARNINEMVSELQNRIKAADEEKETLQSAFASMVEGVIVLGKDSRIEVLNMGMKDMIGPQYENVVGKTVLEAFRNIDLQDALEQLRQTGQAVVKEITLSSENPIILEVNVSSIKAPSGGEGKTIMVFHDVTRLKKLERIRADFVANVTHEIKTPLTAIIGFTETLQQGDFENRTEAIRFLQIIHTHAQRLNRLVDDLLTLSNIELGETKPQWQMLNLDDVIENTLTVIKSKSDEKKINIVKEIPSLLPSLRADRDKLSQILLNVIDNAVKFTPEGGRITIKASQDDAGFITVSIIDTGIGIPKNEISRLGERFYRVDKTRSRDVEGTGLGLSIVKHLMKAHQGRMDIESSLGHGT